MASDLLMSSMTTTISKATCTASWLHLSCADNFLQKSVKNTSLVPGIASYPRLFLMKEQQNHPGYDASVETRQRHCKLTWWLVQHCLGQTTGQFVSQNQLPVRLARRVTCDWSLIQSHDHHVISYTVTWLSCDLIHSHMTIMWLKSHDCHAIQNCNMVTWHKYSTNLTPKPFLPPVLIAHFEYSKPSKNCRQRRPRTNLALFLGHSQIISHGCKMKSSRNEAKTGAGSHSEKPMCAWCPFQGFSVTSFPQGWA